MTVSVTLKPRQYRVAENLAKERAAHRDGRTVYGRDDNDVGEEPYKDHLIGLLGEFAFAQYYGLKINTETSWTDPGYDFLAKLNSELTKIEIRTTTYESGNLLVPVSTTTPDYYVLGHVPNIEAHEVRLIGGCSADRLYQSPTEPSERYDEPNYSLAQSGLDELPDPSAIGTHR
jgi:hypothetical protein